MRPVTVFGHPLHKTLTDIPVGLWIMSLVAQWVATATGSELWWTLAFWNLLAATAASLPIGIIGTIDFLRIPRESAAKATAVYHALSAGTAAACFAASLLAQGGPNPPQPNEVFLVLALSTAGVFFLGIAIRYGQELILRYGIGRMAAIAYAGPERRARPREVVHGR